ncbi:hypothetical protein D3C81_1500980 [compost metagenome]
MADGIHRTGGAAITVAEALKACNGCQQVFVKVLMGGIQCFQVLVHQRKTADAAAIFRWRTCVAYGAREVRDEPVVDFLDDGRVGERFFVAGVLTQYRNDVSEVIAVGRRPFQHPGAGSLRVVGKALGVEGGFGHDIGIGRFAQILLQHTLLVILEVADFLCFNFTQNAQRFRIVTGACGELGSIEMGGPVFNVRDQ